MTDKNPYREAAKNLPGHWHKGDLRDGKGNYCGLGHMKNALGERRYRSMWMDVNELLDDVARELYPERIRCNLKLGFVHFNDHPDTTEDDVVVVLEKAAVRWDESV